MPAETSLVAAIGVLWASCLALITYIRHLFEQREKDSRDRTEKLERDFRLEREEYKSKIAKLEEIDDIRAKNMQLALEKLGASLSVAERQSAILEDVARELERDKRTR